MMHTTKERFLIYGIAIIFIYYILTYANTEKNYFAYSTDSDNNVVENLDREEEVVLKPIVRNNFNLKVEEVSDGIDFPTSMAFLGLDDILVLEKNEGTVKRILNGIMLEEPLLEVAVANDGERGMLGIAIAEKNATPQEINNDDYDGITYVFLYYTELTGEEDDESIRNRLYRYEFDQNSGKLVSPKLLLDLPATPGPTHNGGKIVIGADDNVYLTIGDVGEHDVSDPSTIINAENGPEPDGKAGILKVSQAGIEEESSEAVEGELTDLMERKVADNDSNILGDEHPLNLYYAYGIRNSFGMDFDPVAGKLWDAETGRNFGEEINLVEPGFNSGWMKAQGLWELDETLRSDGIASPNDETFISDLVDFNGRGKYSSPEFTWGKMPITTSGMAFFHSDKLGKQYENDLFVGDFVNGMIFDFDLNQARTQLLFDSKGPLIDKLADTADELEEVIFGYGFGGITDIKIGPEGYLYILSLDEGGSECKPQYPDRACIPYSSYVEGHIFRIIPAGTETVPAE
jgi:aldose sugar dehydrogenase